MKKIHKGILAAEVFLALKERWMLVYLLSLWIRESSRKNIDAKQEEIYLVNTWIQENCRGVNKLILVLNLPQSIALALNVKHVMI